MDPGETEAECALRELEEETGITEAVIRIDPGFRYETRYQVRAKRSNYQWAEKTLVIFLAWLEEDLEIEPTEHVGFQWHAWHPPHEIQTQTIDPLLAQVANHFSDHGQV